jgi:16S rRNA processing protein RimM
LRGAALVEPMTDEPEAVFAPGRALWRLGDEGAPVGDRLVVGRSRVFKGGWLIEFEQVASRSDLEGLSLKWLGAPRRELSEPGPAAMYLHELIGAEIVQGGVRLGVVRDVVEGGGARLLAMEAGGREHLIPFRRPLVQGVDRVGRRVLVDLPPGLLDL